MNKPNYIVEMKFNGRYCAQGVYAATPSDAIAVAVNGCMPTNHPDKVEVSVSLIKR